MRVYSDEMVTAATVTPDDEPIVLRRGDPRPRRSPSRSLFSEARRRINSTAFPRVWKLHSVSGGMK